MLSGEVKPNDPRRTHSMCTWKHCEVSTLRHLLRRCTLTSSSTPVAKSLNLCRTEARYHTTPAQLIPSLHNSACRNNLTSSSPDLYILRPISSQKISSSSARSSLQPQLIPETFLFICPQFSKTTTYTHTPAHKRYTQNSPTHS
jgi:Tfp pilus assembly protein FimT